MICGIDIGLSGAIAWLSDDGHLVAVQDMPTIAVAVGKTQRRRVQASILASMLTERRPAYVMIEEVATVPRDGVVGAFSFGRSFGLVEGVVAGLGISYGMVRPQVWKRSLHVPADKGGARARACQLWPGAAADFARAKDDGRAEAAMIGLYGANTRHGAAPAGPGRLSLQVPVQPLRVVA